MPLLSLHCDIDAALAQVKSLQEDQLPFVIAKSLTTVAQEAQKAVRITEGQGFRLRNDWTVKNTRITPATKTKFESTVYTDTSNRKTGAPDYLERQEEGGQIIPANGHVHRAIPTRYLWKYTPPNRPLPDRFRPAALLPPNAKLGQEYGGNFRLGSSTGSKVKRRIGRESMKKLGTGDFVAFLQTTKSGTLCIFVRHGGLAYHAGQNDAEPWYTLVRGAQVKPRLHMEETVKAVVTAQFEEIFVAVAEQVGISVKL